MSDSYSRSMGSVCTSSVTKVVYPVNTMDQQPAHDQAIPNSFICNNTVNGHVHTGHVKPTERRNQFGDSEDCRMTIEKWEQRWDKGQTRFHMPCVHPQLQKHVSVLTGGEPAQRVFMPLCGKSVDMMWLAQRGHLVIGCEAVKLGCQQFYEEHNIPYTTEPLQSLPGTLFKSTDPSLAVTIYCCDFFKLTSDITGEIDCIWDRGSLAAIDKEDRRSYCEVITRLLNPRTRYLVDVFILDHDVFAGPPYSLPSEEMDSLFGHQCNMEKVDEVDAMTDWQREWGVTYFISHDYLITLKPNL